MSGENEPITVRRLPNGAPQPALLHNITSHLLHINLLPGAPNVEFKTGTLVEVACEQAVYLGEVQGRRSSLLMIAVEHAIGRSSLSALEEIWHCSQGA